MKPAKGLDVTKKTAQQTFREILRDRSLDCFSTEEAAKLTGFSEATVVKVLKKLADEGFRSECGASFVYNEGVAKHRNGLASEKQPKRYNWFFT